LDRRQAMAAWWRSAAPHSAYPQALRARIGQAPLAALPGTPTRLTRTIPRTPSAQTPDAKSDAEMESQTEA